MLRGHLSRLAMDPCGCRVVQRLFEVCRYADLAPVVGEVLEAAVELAVNQYGNYVIQNILEEGPDEDVAALLRRFEGQFYRFATHKFASNVLERCIRRATAAQREHIFEEVIGKAGRIEDRRIVLLAGDQFGNYVLQRVFEIGSQRQISAIFGVVTDHHDDLTKRPHARHVIARLEEMGYGFA